MYVQQFIEICIHKKTAYESQIEFYTIPTSLKVNI